MMRQFPVPRRRAVLPAVVVALFLLPSVVLAHAELVKSTPKDGAALDASPTEIFATYSEAMDPSGSSLKLVDKDDTELATGGVDPDDAKRMSVDDVPDLAPGTYTVRSTTKSAEDGDIDRAEWSFTITAAATPEPSATPTATATPTASASPSPSATASASPSASPSASASASATAGASPATTDGSDASSGGDVLLPIIFVAVIVAIAAAYLYSRREKPPTDTPPTGTPPTETPPTEA
jgi:methionine-rich copper-binding protein CopC